MMNKIIIESDFSIENIKNDKIKSQIQDWQKSLEKNIKKDIVLSSSEGTGWLLTEKPSLFFIQEKFALEDIQSVLFFVEKNIYKIQPEYETKIFHFDKKGKNIEIQNLIRIKENKKLLSSLLKEKLANNDKVFPGNLQKEIEKYLENPVVYFDATKIGFVFDRASGVAPRSAGVIRVEFPIEKLVSVLNTQYFPKIVDHIKQIQEKKKKMLSSGKKYVALTFDDGPHRTRTPRLLEILKKNNVKATFFLLGSNANRYPEIVKQEKDGGHQVESHSWGHPNFLHLSVEKAKAEINNTDDVIKKATWEKPKFFRPPYGAFNDKTLMLTDKVFLLWDVDSQDWKNKDVQRNLANVRKTLQAGSIILFHDIHEASVDTIEPLIHELRGKGYEFVTVKELLDFYDGNSKGRVCVSGKNCKKWKK